MIVAKSYENLPFLSEPFEENGKGYVIVQLKSGKEKKVRYYGELNPTNYKIARGYNNGYIHAIRGNIKANEKWLEETAEAWFNVPTGWFVSSKYQELPRLPSGLYYIKLTWDEVELHMNDKTYIDKLIKQKEK